MDEGVSEGERERETVGKTPEEEEELDIPLSNNFICVILSPSLLN